MITRLKDHKISMISGLAVIICSLFSCFCGLAQDVHFTVIPPPNNEPLYQITGMAQDPQGFIWIGCQNGLRKYDGHQYTSYYNDPLNPNSLADSWVESIFADKDGIIWIGTEGSGLDRFDPATGSFIHYRHKKNDLNSIANDHVTAIIKDDDGALWLGTDRGLDKFEPKTGRFFHHIYNSNDPGSISNNTVRVLYQDKMGTIWVGCGSIFPNETPKGAGGLNKLDKKTGRFTRYLHDDKDPNSLIDNRVRAIFEDSRGTFWVGTPGDGLHTMDRKKGTFEHHAYNPAHPDKLSRPPLKRIMPRLEDEITFITEDITGKIWIGTFQNGINVFDPKTQKVVHYSADKNKTGLATDALWYAYKTRDGSIWITSWGYGNNTNIFALYKINPYQTRLPYEHTGNLVFGFAEDSAKNLWMASRKGIILQDFHQPSQTFVTDTSVITGNTRIWHIEKDIEKNKLWLATYRCLISFDPVTKIFTSFHHKADNKNSLISDSVVTTYQDKAGRLWVGTDHSGLDLMDTRNGTFKHFKNNLKDTNSISNDFIRYITADKKGNLWIGTTNGINRLNEQTRHFKRYLQPLEINCIAEDDWGNLWAGTGSGLFKYDPHTDNFTRFNDDLGVINTPRIAGITRILKDHDKNLWLGTSKGMIKLNAQKEETMVYGRSKGFRENAFLESAYVRQNGDLLVGDTAGYFEIQPGGLLHDSPPAMVYITNFSLADIPVAPAPGNVLTAPLIRTKIISLSHVQNTFSFGFHNIDYVSEGEDNQLFYRLENYDASWHTADESRTAYYFNVGPGNYIFKVKAINSSGIWAEKDITVIVSPPWWQTWWAYILFTLTAICGIWSLVYYRSLKLRRENQLLEEKIQIRTKQLSTANEELQEQQEEIMTQRDELSKTVNDLKATQTQLIQSEKMASMGELTAGIAHEIQNPLNFVNNFSELSIELLTEMENELDHGDRKEATAIASDIKQNLEKISLHGKRADSIVKNMLQHSRQSSGTKEPTDINALADEYLRLAYHGLRAKDKTFSATLHTRLDKGIGKINIISQDIGRVFLNLFNNAFYAVTEKTKIAGTGYNPTVTLTTKTKDGEIIITVADNGNGMPQNIIDKIFQPFFTTKPTGQGTGLGLSLSYEIIKVHGGEIKVETREGEGTEFIISLSAGPDGKP
jgi:signal transduction histidine kinase/ligand-binding sensor domain-containing protein